MILRLGIHPVSSAMAMAMTLLMVPDMVFVVCVRQGTTRRINNDSKEKEVVSLYAYHDLSGLLGNGNSPSASFNFSGNEKKRVTGGNGVRIDPGESGATNRAKSHARFPL
jgi:hypothetical protein